VQDQGQGLQIRKLAGVRHPRQFGQRQFDHLDILVLAGQAAARAGAGRLRIGADEQGQPFRRDARHGEGIPDQLQFGQCGADLLHRLASCGRLGVLARVDQAGGRLQQTRIRRAGQQDAVSQLAHQQGRAPLRIIGQDGRRHAVILDLAHDLGSVIQFDGRLTKGRPARMQHLEGEDLGHGVGLARPGRRGRW
jgi:hypothetical protein